MTMRAFLLGAAIILPAGVTACAPTQADSKSLNHIEDKLTDSDPVIKGALEDQIMVDPKLTQQANANAVSPGNRPLDGGAPITRVMQGGDPDYIATPAGGKLMKAPAPQEMKAEDCQTCGRDPVTAGARAADMAPKTCTTGISYGLEWANRMPEAFPVYPRAELKEAAGIAGNNCNVRVVNFQTRAPLEAVVDYYYTQALRFGYDAEHLTKGSEHYLGGTRTRDDTAYVVILNPMPNGMTDVDIVASGGK